MTLYKGTRSMGRPQPLDITETRVFIATDIHEVTVPGMEDGEEGHIEYEYDLAEYDKDEYIQHIHDEQETQNEVLDFLLMGGE